MSDRTTFTRREFLQYSALAGGLALSGPLPGAQNAPRPKVAAVFTELRFRSHAYNILENFLRPYLFRGKLVDPGVEVVSFYADQFPDNDMAREVSQRFKIPLFKSIDEALCLGSKELAVDAVLSIGEHGDYPLNELGQRQYPRKEFFDQSVAVMQRSGRFVPLFNDKHLSYRWDWSKAMYDTARRHGFPLMAGSSVPLAQRRPDWELPAGAEIEEAVSVHGGGLESYDFHGLEVLQSIVEGRKGGETGIRRIELVSGDALAAAAREGRWSKDLVDAALAAEAGLDQLRQPRPASIPLPPSERKEDDKQIQHALLITYKDGLRAAVLKVGYDSNRWNFACRVKGQSQPQAVAFFNSPWGNRGLFKALSHAIQHLFVQRREPYPVERTLLVSGALDAALHSHAQGGKAIDTPHLEFSYPAIDFRSMRENGASWKIITRQTPQPIGFEPGDAARAG
jgi:hypothetical protein